LDLYQVYVQTFLYIEYFILTQQKEKKEKWVINFYDLEQQQIITKEMAEEFIKELEIKKYSEVIRFLDNKKVKEIIIDNSNIEDLTIISDL